MRSATRFFLSSHRKRGELSDLSKKSWRSSKLKGLVWRNEVSWIGSSLDLGECKLACKGDRFKAEWEKIIKLASTRIKKGWDPGAVTRAS